MFGVFIDVNYIDGDWIRVNCFFCLDSGEYFVSINVNNMVEDYFNVIEFDL